jgi:tetratricopeptide (TPR) repeat protein
MTHYTSAIKDAPPSRAKAYFLQVLGIGDAHQNKRGLLTCCGDLLLKRFQQTSDMHDITNTIFAYELAFKLVPSSDPEYLIYMQDIAISYMLRYRLPGAGCASDLGQAISGYEIVVDGMPNTHRGMPLWLNNLSILLENRYERTRRSADLDKAIAVQRRVLRSSPKGHAAIPGRLNNLGILLYNRFEHSEDLGDLSDALSTVDEAICLNPDMPALLETKAKILLERLKKSRELVDIEEVIRVCQTAVDLTPKGDPGLPQRLNHLGHSYDGRFEARGHLGDINKAIELKYRGIDLASRNHRKRAQWLDSLAGSLLRRFPCTEDLEDLTQAISAEQEAAEISPDVTHKSTLLNNLASSLVHRYFQTGDMADLNRAILAQHKAIEAIDTQPNYSGRLRFMNNLGTHLALRFRHTRVSTDIDDAIDFHQNVVRLTDEKDLAMHSRMDDLATALATRYQHSRKSSDLEGAILAGRQAIKLARLNGLPDLPNILGNLGPILLCSFQREHRLEDVNEAIHKLQEATSLTPDGHGDLRRYSLNLSICFQSRFEHTNDITDINEAIAILQKVLNLSSEMNADMCNILHYLGTAFGLRYDHSGERQDLEIAISKHRAAAMYPIGPPSKRLTAASHWVARANLIDPQQTLDGLGMSIELLSQVAGLEQTIEERYTNIVKTKNLSPTAAAIAIANGKCGLALEWLEQSRCLVWNQVNTLRAPIDELHSYDEDLANDLLRVSRALEVAGSRQTSSIIDATIAERVSTQSQVNSHLKHSREWEQLLKKIRKIPQFQDFLRPPRAPSLLKNLPKTGFVVVINVFKERCNALALVSGLDAPQHIALPDFSYERAENFRQRLKQYLIINHVRMRDDEELTRTLRPLSDLDDNLLSEILCVLWLNVVKPIFHSLGIPVSLSSLSTIEG